MNNMNPVKEHYDARLSKVYGWMLGDFDEKVQQQLQYFHQAGIQPAHNPVAIDIGCGNGIQAMALQQLGFSVTAVDFSRPLLDELARRAGESNIIIIEADAADTAKYARQAGLIVCMGDTLTHFESIPLIEHLFTEWLQLLTPGGRLVLSFRELDTELENEQRFIPVRSDDDRILTCFLDYREGYVMVHDLLYEKEGGQWHFSMGAYKKLRLSRNQVAGMLVKAGFSIKDGRTANGMLCMIAHA